MCAPRPTARVGGDAEFRSMYPDLPSPSQPRPVGAMKWLFALLGFVLVMVINVVGPGCGTLMNQTGVVERRRPYGGLRTDFDVLRKEPSLIFLDVPFSFAADTLCLPIDLCRNAPPAKVGGGNHAIPPAESR